ncbi:MAG TPA: DUF2244 domain-containing protein [Dongiaceae bacterium]
MLGSCEKPLSPPRERGWGEGAPPPHNAGQTERPIFEALLYPHRSLSERGLLILTIGTIAIITLWGGLFLILGAWPIFGFIGGEWLLFWWLLRTHFRNDRGAERIRLYADRLVLQQIDPKGNVAESTFEPYWLQVVLAERGFENPALLLRSHGEAVEIGTFLGAGERRQFAEQLQAALARWRAT